MYMYIYIYVYIYIHANATASAQKQTAIYSFGYCYLLLRYAAQHPLTPSSISGSTFSLLITLPPTCPVFHERQSHSAFRSAPAPHSPTLVSCKCAQ